MYEKVSDAIIFSSIAHKGQHRKLTNTPYIFHPLNVAALIATITDDEDTITAGVLHDVVEDTGISLDTIKKQFGENVCRLVESETEDKHRDKPASETWMQRKAESTEVLKNTTDINVKILWICDKLDNLRSFKSYYHQHGDQLWQNFNQKDPEMHKWYYGKVLEYTKELADTHVYKDFLNIYNELFNGGNK